MNDILSSLIGKQVQVYSDRGGQAEVSDTGMLESYDSNWLCLNRNGDRLYFSIARVRLIKPL